MPNYCLKIYVASHRVISLAHNTQLEKTKLTTHLKPQYVDALNF